MLIQGEKISLRLITLADTEHIIEWRNKDSVRKNFIYQGLFTPASHEKWMEEQVGTGKVVQYIITRNTDGKDVGSVYFRDIDPVNRKAEYGIFIGVDDARGQGLGSEVAKLACEYAFENLNLHKIFLRVFADNIGARKSYENGGFVEVGCFHDEVLQEGRYRDVVFMEKINKDN